MQRRHLLLAAAGFATPLVAGCTGGGGNGGGAVEETTEVAMVDSQFVPKNIHVPTGATVTWTNDDSHGHTVTNASDNWSFDGSVDGGETVEHTFDASGVYDAYCRFHGSADLTGMSMKIAVGEATIEEPLGGGSGGGTGPYG